MAIATICTQYFTKPLHTPCLLGLNPRNRPAKQEDSCLLSPALCQVLYVLFLQPCQQRQRASSVPLLPPQRRICICDSESLGNSPKISAQSWGFNPGLPDSTAEVCPALPDLLPFVDEEADG